MMLDHNWLVTEIFNLDSNVRFVAVVDDKNRIVASKLRADITNLVPPNEEQDFISFITPIGISMAEKLNPFFGDLDYVSAQYKEVLLCTFRVKNLTVILTFDPAAKPRLLTNIAEKIKTLAEKN